MSRTTKGRLVAVGFLAVGIVTGWTTSNAEVKPDVPTAAADGNTAMATETTDATF